MPGPRGVAVWSILLWSAFSWAYPMLREAHRSQFSAALEDAGYRPGKQRFCRSHLSPASCDQSPAIGEAGKGGHRFHPVARNRVKFLSASRENRQKDGVVSRPACRASAAKKVGASVMPRPAIAASRSTSARFAGNSPRTWPEQARDSATGSASDSVRRWHECVAVGDT
jgi:hypothetical protein